MPVHTEDSTAMYISNTDIHKKKNNLSNSIHVMCEICLPIQNWFFFSLFVLFSLCVPSTRWYVWILVSLWLFWTHRIMKHQHSTKTSILCCYFFSIFFSFPTSYWKNVYIIIIEKCFFPLPPFSYSFPIVTSLYTTTRTLNTLSQIVAMEKSLHIFDSLNNAILKCYNILLEFFIIFLTRKLINLFIVSTLQNQQTITRTEKIE